MEDIESRCGIYYYIIYLTVKCREDEKYELAYQVLIYYRNVNLHVGTVVLYIF